MTAPTINPEVGPRCGICRLGLWHPAAKHKTGDPQCLARGEQP